jgi:hypothetical protein
MTMRVRQDILQILSELSEECPDLRFGQLVANLSYLAKGPANEAIWDVEDEEFLAAARAHLYNRTGKDTAPSNESLRSPQLSHRT